MSRAKGSPGRFDAYRLAHERGVVEGSVDPHELARVADLIAVGPASIVWRIDGTRDAAGRPALTVTLKGAVSVACQRCLAEFDWPVEQRSEVLLAHDARELAALDADSESEVVLAEGSLDPLTLVEDELVLALPFAPRHPEGACDSTMTNRRA
ncbi:MAG: YceD family protein [Rudaea sp.]